jgi:antitoxin component of MazEF toxin-antitoxin module
MLFMPLRKQGSATVITLPSSVLKSLNLKVGDELQLDVLDGTLVMVHVLTTRSKRYTLAQLLASATPTAIRALNYDVARSRTGDAVGCELA